MTFLFTSIFGSLFVLLLLFYKCCLYYQKKFASFPFMNTWWYLLRCQVLGEITKITPLNNVLFEKLVLTGKKYIEEGLFMTFWSRPVLFIYNAEAVKFFTNEKAAKDKSSDYDMLEEIMGAGIGTSNGERWRSHRKLMNPAFNLGMLARIIPIFNEHAMALVKDMENIAGKPNVEIIEILKLHYFSTICEFSCGLKRTDDNAAEIKRIVKYIDHLTDMTIRRVICPWLRPKFILHLIPSGRKYFYYLKECDDFIYQIILDVKKNLLSEKNNDVNDFGNDLSKSVARILLKQHLVDPTFTIKDVHDEVKTIISTGYDTVSYTTMWCLFLLGLHPEIQEKAFSEIESKTSDYITLEECNDLTYLEAIVKETLRLYATVPIYIRYLTEDVQYEKYKVEKGTAIAFFPYILHKEPKMHPDPEQFKPERFLNGELNAKYGFIPFAEGSRSCIGKNHSMMEIKIFLAHILKNFKIISLDKREDVRLCWSVVVSPTQTLRLQIMQRST